MGDLESRDLIFDWNARGSRDIHITGTVQFHDETLREGLQSLSATEPDLSGKLEILRHMEKVGVDVVNLGGPGSNPRSAVHARRLIQEVQQERLRVRPALSSRAVIADVDAVADVAQDSGLVVEADIHLPTSALLREAHGWHLDRVRQKLDAAIREATRHDLMVTFVAEDATRTHPADLWGFLRTAVEAGAVRICVCDSAGCITPAGARRVLQHVRQAVGPAVGLDWSGRNDRGLGLEVALTALSSGVTRVHGTILGLGEGAGSLALDTLMTNLALIGLVDENLAALKAYCEAVSRLYGVDIPVNYPALGGDAFRTATGVHAAAIIKARKKGDAWLADRIYSGVPAGFFGRRQQIEVGPMSGASNVSCWLEDHSIPYTQEDVAHILQVAKQSNRTMTEAEIRAVLAPEKEAV